MRLIARTRVLAHDEPIPKPEFAILPSHLQAVGFDPWSEDQRCEGLWPYVSRAPVPLSQDTRPTDCWLFDRGTRSGGAGPGTIWIGAERWSAARVAWVLGTEGLEADWLLGPDSPRVPGRPLREGERVIHLCRTRSTTGPGFQGVCVNPRHLGIAGPDLMPEELMILLRYGRADLVHPSRAIDGLSFDHPRVMWWRRVAEAGASGMPLDHILDDPFEVAARAMRLRAFEDHFWSRSTRSWADDPVLDPDWLEAEADRVWRWYHDEVDARRVRYDSEWDARRHVESRWHDENPPCCWEWLGDHTNGYGRYNAGDGYFVSARQVVWSLAVTGDEGGAPRLDPAADGVITSRRIRATCGNARCIRNDSLGHHLVTTAVPSSVWDVIEQTGWNLTSEPLKSDLATDFWLTARAVEKAAVALASRE